MYKKIPVEIQAERHIHPQGAPETSKSTTPKNDHENSQKQIDSSPFPTNNESCVLQ